MFRILLIQFGQDSLALEKKSQLALPLHLYLLHKYMTNVLHISYIEGTQKFW